MRCPSCHHDNRFDRRFCTECGTKLAVGCSSCGAPIKAGEKFCGGCGAALTTGGEAPPTRSPAAHAPRLLADKIRQAKATVEGERGRLSPPGPERERLLAAARRLYDEMDTPGLAGRFADGVAAGGAASR